MDNDLIPETDEIFTALSILPNLQFYSCRNFIVLKDKAAD